MVCIPQVYATQEVTKWNGDTESYGLYTSGMCYPRGNKLNEMVTVSYALYTSGIPYPRGYKMKWWHSELWFVYLRYTLPKRLQNEMVTQWVMVCIPQVYPTQEVTKWNGDTVSYGLYTSGIGYPRGYKLNGMVTQRVMVCIPQVCATQEVTN